MKSDLTEQKKPLAIVARVLLSMVGIAVSFIVSGYTGWLVGDIYVHLYARGLGIPLGTDALSDDYGMGFTVTATVLLAFLEILPFACFSFVRTVKYLFDGCRVASILYCLLVPMSSLVAMVLTAFSIVFANLAPELVAVIFFVIFPFAFFFMKRVLKTHFAKKFNQE
jgi:hypothetical protein